MTGAPSNAVVPLPGAPFDACFVPAALAELAGRGAPPSSGQNPGGIGLRISASIGAIGVTPATGSTWKELQLYAYAPASRPSR